MINVSCHDAVAVITINNPPVNAMSPGVPRGIIEAVAAANSNPDVTAMVLHGWWQR